MRSSFPTDRRARAGASPMTMQFVHDLDRVRGTAGDDQERVFGRTKPTGRAGRQAGRLPHRPGRGGRRRRRRARGLPAQRARGPLAATQGLHFVSFGADLDRFDLQLRHQYGLVDDGIIDRLLEFTTPMTGSFWLCPSVDDLDRIAPVPDDEDE